MKVWITKYALTSGVFTREVDEPTDHDPGTIVDRSSGCHDIYNVHGRDWHRTREGALARAVEMRAAKIKSLGKQINKLRAMTIEVPK
jgi:hypothetical protein